MLAKIINHDYLVDEVWLKAYSGFTTEEANPLSNDYGKIAQVASSTICIVLGNKEFVRGAEKHIFSEVMTPEGKVGFLDASNLEPISP